MENEGEYSVYYGDQSIGSYYILEDGSTEYYAYDSILKDLKGENIPS
jgi:hypothetical protein